MKENVTQGHATRQAAGEAPSMPGFGPWANGAGDAIAHVTNIGADMMKRAAGVAEEIAAFSQQRFRHGIESWTALMSCRTPTELFECQRRMAETAANDYFDEASRLAARIVGAVNAGAGKKPGERAMPTT